MNAPAAAPPWALTPFLNILQFLAPTLQFMIGWRIFGEPLAPASLASFALIWTAVALYALGSRRANVTD